MNAAGLLIGIGFGFVLGWSRLTDYDVIHEMLLLRQFDVFLLMGAAVATAAVAIRLLRASGARSLIDNVSISWTLTRPTRNHFVGAVIFGTGWALSGTCPGPAAAQLGRGQLAALFTLAGIFCGVALFGYLKRRRETAPAPPRDRQLAGTEPGL
jgi:uncharacterized membrane protein YedE/YeeE